MKYFKLFLLLVMGYGGAMAQSVTNFTLSLDEMTLTGLPGKQSFAWGQHDGQWLIIGGRTDGLHERQPFAAFQSAGNNAEILVVDPVLGQFWTAGLTSLPQNLQEQLQSTNMNFAQRDSVLYLTGGYSYSPTAGDHTTYGNLVAVDVPGMIQAVKQSSSLASHVRHVAHSGMAVTGGQMERLGDVFYLVGGQYFEGRYNPMGPNHGPGFIQQYTNAIRTFEISDNGSTLAVQNYSEVVDTMELHRRDYNLIPQIFPNGHRGFTAFTGVFQYLDDLPWLNVVDIDSLGYTPVPVFEQLFSHYHSARLPIYETGSGRMHNYFFGGMAQYYLNAQGGLVNDVNVPFVKMISRVTRFPNDSLVEYDTGMEMPGFLGAGAEFFPSDSSIFYESEILNVDALPPGKHLAGYIYGGIESSADNIFFTQTGVESWPSNRIFKVYIEKTSTGMLENGGEIRDLNVWPNPSEGMVRVDFQAPGSGAYRIELWDEKGVQLMEKVIQVNADGKVNEEVELPAVADGVYFLSINGENVQATKRIRLMRE